MKAGPFCLDMLASQRKTGREIDAKDRFLFHNEGHS